MLIFVRCYDCVFSVDGPTVMKDLLAERGFEADLERPEGEVKLAFRMEAQGDFYNLYRGDARSSQQQTPAIHAEMVVHQIHHAVSVEVDSLTFLRGSTVQAPDGSAVVLAGGLFTGKTQLAQALVARGAQPWSHFFAVLNEKGEALPYPSREVPTEGLPISAILNVGYQPKGTWDVRTPTPGETALNLTPLVMGTEQAVPQALPRLGKLATSTEVRWLGRRGPAEQAVSEITSLDLWKTPAAR